MSGVPDKVWFKTRLKQLAKSQRGLAQHLACSVRSVELLMAEGMPHAILIGRVKFRVSEIEPWLEHAGHLERRAATLKQEEERPGSGVTPPGQDTRS